MKMKNGWLSGVACALLMSLVAGAQAGQIAYHSEPPGLLANDQLGEGQGARVVLVDKPTSKGVHLVLRPDGSFTFITNKRGAQTFTFTYRIINGDQTSDTAAVTISAATG